MRRSSAPPCLVWVSIALLYLTGPVACRRGCAYSGRNNSYVSHADTRAHVQVASLPSWSGLRACDSSG